MNVQVHVGSYGILEIPVGSWIGFLPAGFINTTQLAEYEITFLPDRNTSSHPYLLFHTSELSLTNLREQKCKT